jgi:hypothetical protein
MKAKNKNLFSRNPPPFETRMHSLSGYASMDLKSKEDLNSLALKFVERYNPDRFDAMALRMFIQGKEPSLYLYSVDKFKMEQDNYPKNKLPVKKFKLNITFEKLMHVVKRFDFTLGNDAYDIGDMLITNK